jgi:hypothetical protein
MGIQPIWPAPPLAEWNGVPPPIPEDVTVYGVKMERGKPEDSGRRVSEVVAEIVERMMGMLEDRKVLSTEEVAEETEEVERMFTEAFRALSSYREAEARKSIAENIKEKIEKKKKLLEEIKGRRPASNKKTATLSGVKRQTHGQT